ncbi:MAG: PhzF family phenazine biosynthesis protein [Spirochaetota bacterium]
MIKVFIVDAFTSEMFKGNPAAVCVLSTGIPDELMQSIAREMNCPETAFVLPQDNGFLLRWFAPLQEVDLCGHATLATSHVLYEQHIATAQQELKFYTRSGLLIVKKEGDIITMNFPQEIATEYSIPQWVIEALGVKPVYTGKNRMDYLIEVKTEEEVLEINPDFIALKKMDSRGVIITAKSSRMEYDFVSRFFAPGLGVNEDPVTGSAHCCLGPYWQQKLQKSTFTAYQASERGGVLKVEVGDDRVYIGGKAVTVLSGHINI